mmetsp:Transcript_134753/g.319407  ORF Transcript_134753/g.319407 Transcript_134753/m.319407 type:complete len:216 (+) Transcript_134753:188-835(+)
MLRHLHASVVVRMARVRMPVQISLSGRFQSSSPVLRVERHTLEPKVKQSTNLLVEAFRGSVRFLEAKTQGVISRGLVDGRHVVHQHHHALGDEGNAIIRPQALHGAVGKEHHIRVFLTTVVVAVGGSNHDQRITDGTGNSEGSKLPCSLQLPRMHLQRVHVGYKADWRSPVVAIVRKVAWIAPMPDAIVPEPQGPPDCAEDRPRHLHSTLVEANE